MRDYERRCRAASAFAGLRANCIGASECSACNLQYNTGLNSKNTNNPKRNGRLTVTDTSPLVSICDDLIRKPGNLILSGGTVIDEFKIT